MDDPRAAPVEDNLAAFYRVVATAPGLSRVDLGAVTTFTSGLPHPLLNGVVARRRFEPGTEQERLDEALAPLEEARIPYLWWCGPSVWSEALDQALAARGVQAELLPGMHHDLGHVPVAPLPSDAELRVGDRCPLDEFTRVMVAGFGLPEELVDTFTAVLAHFDPDRLVNVVATLDGAPVGCGSLWLTGATAGLYNIATVVPARGRGVGHAVTAALMAIGRERGCRESVLVASELGEPVYRRLGFERVCSIHEYAWSPC